jgi:hypothetical protein
MRSPRAWPEPKGLLTMSERLLETFREKAEQVARVPAFELIEAAGRARRRRRHVAGSAVGAFVLATTGILFATNEPDAPPQPADKPDDTSLVTPYPGNQGQALDKGTYEFELPDPSLPDVRFTLPPGWNSWIGPNLFEGYRDEEAAGKDSGWYLGLLVLDVRSIAQQGCSTTDLTAQDPATVVQAFTRAARLRVTSGPERTVRFGRPTTHLRLEEQGPSGECLNSVLMFGSEGSGITYFGRGTTFDCLVVDLDGRPLTMLATWTRGTPRAEVEALLGVVDSIELVDGDPS